MREVQASDAAHERAFLLDATDDDGVYHADVLPARTAGKHATQHLRRAVRARARTHPG